MAFGITKYSVIITALLGYLFNETNGGLARLVCGSNWQLYNPLMQVCKDGQIFDITDSPTAITLTPSFVDPNSAPVKRRSCRDYADLLICNGKLLCGRSQGYKCCGFGVYNPRNQTCCQLTSSEYAIHDGKPEKTHICCLLDVYERGSPDVTCQHSADNDKFFQKPKRLTSDEGICREAKYAYRIDILGHIQGQYLTARVGTWPWQPNETHRKSRMEKHPKLEEVMTIKLDRFSPKKKNLTRKAFLVFSEHQYLKDAVFFLRKNDDVYRSPKSRRRMVRKFRKTYRKCKSSM